MNKQTQTVDKDSPWPDSSEAPLNTPCLNFELQFFVCLESSCVKNPAGSLSWESPPSFSYPGLPSARILSGWFRQNCFLLVGSLVFLPPHPQIPRHKPSLVLIFGVESHLSLSLLLKNAEAVVPFQMKFSLLNKCHDKCHVFDKASHYLATGRMPVGNGAGSKGQRQDRAYLWRIP